MRVLRILLTAVRRAILRVAFLADFVLAINHDPWVWRRLEAGAQKQRGGKPAALAVFIVAPFREVHPPLAAISAAPLFLAGRTIKGRAAVLGDPPHGSVAARLAARLTCPVVDLEAVLEITEFAIGAGMVAQG